jgi:Ca2+-binding RTX toxin-like protein
LYSGGGNDYLYGGAGADWLFSTGSDRQLVELRGDNGDDHAYGRDAYDMIGGGNGDVLNGTAAAAVSMDLASPAGNTGDAAGDSYISIEGVIGSAYGDSLRGDSLANTIYGENGADRIFGRGGNDKLYGGNSADTFVIDTTLGTATNMDTIMDFSVPNDTIELENAIMTLLTATGTLNAALFKDLDTGVQDADDVILYTSSNGGIFYDINGLGTGGRSQIADVANGLILTAADFVVI